MGTAATRFLAHSPSFTSLWRGYVLSLFSDVVFLHKFLLHSLGANFVFRFRLLSRRGLVVTVSDSHARGRGFEAASTHNEKTIGEGM